jgi:mannose-6-phosphate isomerase-like protein (cupin superfamily)
MNILQSSSGTENKSTSHPDRVDDGIRRRSAIVNGSALAATALMARANAALAQQTDQTAGSQPAPKPNPSVRRVVTGTDSRGRSHVLMDGNPTHVFGGFLTQVWVTDRVPASNTGTKDNAERPQRLEPPPGGTQLVYFALAPQSASASVPPAEMEKNVAGMFEALGASHARVDTSRNVGMHKTKTVDYVILLSGEVDLLLDDGEVHLKPSDIVIQRGTNHAWVNTGTETALLAGVLIDAEPMGM